VPGHTRSIYSRRQRLGPARFDNPLADFLDRLPDYFNDYQRNQLALERQQLADKRYNDQQEQQEFRNELSLANLLTGADQAKFLESSSNPRLQRIGVEKRKSEESFQSILNPDDMSEDDVSRMSYFEGVLKDPNVRGNPAREKQVKSMMENIRNKSIVSSIDKIISTDPTNNSYKLIRQKALIDAPGAYEDILKLEGKKLTRGDRKTARGRDNVLRYIDDGEPVFKGLEEKATPSARLEALQEEIKEIRRSLRGREGETSDAASELRRRQKKIRDEIDRLSGIIPDQGNFLNLDTMQSGNVGGLNFNTVQPESTGTRFDIKLDF
jgi:hypothetical protein